MIVKEMKQETSFLSYFLILYDYLLYDFLILYDFLSLYDYVYVILYVNVNENEIF